MYTGSGEWCPSLVGCRVYPSSNARSRGYKQVERGKPVPSLGAWMCVLIKVGANIGSLCVGLPLFRWPSGPFYSLKGVQEVGLPRRGGEEREK